MAWTWFGRILFWQSHAIDSPNLLFHFFLLSICSFHCNLVWISVRFFYSCLNNRKNKLMTTYQLSDGNVFYLQRNFCFCLNSLSINLKKQPKRILQHWSYFFLTWCFFFLLLVFEYVCACSFYSKYKKTCRKHKRIAFKTIFKCFSGFECSQDFRRCFSIQSDKMVGMNASSATLIRLLLMLNGSTTTHTTISKFNGLSGYMSL